MKERLSGSESYLMQAPVEENRMIGRTSKFSGSNFSELGQNKN